MNRARPFLTVSLLAALATVPLVACRDRGGGSIVPVEAKATQSATVAAAPAVRSTETPIVAPAYPGCGTSLPADLAAGRTTVQKLTSSGRERSYRLHVPATYNPAKPAPLVLNFHGRGSNGLEQEAYSGLVPLSDREGFILVSPDGIDNSWLLVASADDVGFTRDLVARIREGLCVDRARVFATGISNGGYMSSALACAAGDVVAAVAPVAGVSGPVGQCRGPVPILEFHGTEDKLVPFEGGPTVGGLPFAGVVTVMGRWSAHNGCESKAAEETVSPHVKKLVYPGCKADTVHYVIEGGGHTWPGAPDVARLGPVTKEISATELIWAFFREHGRK